MKNHEKPKFNDYIEELQSQEEFISRRKLIEFWRESMLRGKIWYRDGNTQIQSIRGMWRGDSNNKRKRCRRGNVSNMVPIEERYDENHEFEIAHMAKIKEGFKQRRFEKFFIWHSPDGDRQLPSKRKSKIRKTYPQAGEYKADELLMAS